MLPLTTAATTTAPRPQALSAAVVISGSHASARASTYPINITISIKEGRYAYLTSLAQVTG